MTASPAAITTMLRTADGLIVYDLDPGASELWAVAGPPDVDPMTIDPDDLPNGFRWVDDAEWSAAVDAQTTPMESSSCHRP